MRKVRAQIWLFAGVLVTAAVSSGLEAASVGTTLWVPPTTVGSWDTEQPLSPEEFQKVVLDQIRLSKRYDPIPVLERSGCRTSTCAPKTQPMLLSYLA